MTLKPLLLIPALGLACLLSACAGPMPQPDPSEAWIGSQEEGSNDLMAERVDGRKVDDGRYFQVKPGAHRLDVTLFEESVGDANQQDCNGHLSYSGFKAGEHTSWWSRAWAARCRRACMTPRASNWPVPRTSIACPADRSVCVVEIRTFRSS